MRSSQACQGFARKPLTMRKPPSRPAFPETDKGLYHGARPRRKDKIIPPKLPGWTPTIIKRWVQPTIVPHKWYFPSLGKTYVLQTSMKALKAIDLCGGVEPYLFRTRPEKLGIVGMKLRTLVIEAQQKQKERHLKHSKAAYLAKHPSQPDATTTIYPEPVVLWSWMQNAELNDLRSSCLRCGQQGHQANLCTNQTTILGTKSIDKPIRDVHSSEAGPSDAHQLCSSYHHMGECEATEKCSTQQAGACPLCQELHPAYEHTVDALRNQGVDIDYRPTPIEDVQLGVTESSSAAGTVKDQLAREEAWAMRLLRVQNLAASLTAAQARWEQAGRPSLEAYQPPAPPQEESVTAMLQMLNLGDLMIAERDRQYRRRLAKPLDRPALAVARV